MKSRLMALAFVFSVWTYGSESLDILMAKTEWDAFSATLQCKAQDDKVYCLVNDKWATIDNRPLLTPWGIDQSAGDDL